MIGLILLMIGIALLVGCFIIAPLSAVVALMQFRIFSFFGYIMVVIIGALLSPLILCMILGGGTLSVFGI